MPDTPTPPLPTLRLTNTATGRKEPFTPIDASRVGFYACGPTVYNDPHIGNYSTYIFNDVLKRSLRFLGYGVHHVMNLTDVDDKMITKSRELGITMQELGDRYAAIFLSDLAQLNVEPPDVVCRATAHIDAMIALVARLVEKGAAYTTEDGSVYFSIAKFPRYGDLAHLDPNALGLSGRPASSADEAYEKDDVRDFALWKAWTPDDGDVAWESPWGRGRPGWHIECSAMSMQYLGESFDLHTGAVDLVFPHHTNEIAQSEAATGVPFVRCWLHRGFLTMGDAEKMAKRVGNVLLLKDIAASPDPHVRALEALSFRLLVASSHYRSRLLFSSEQMAMHETNLLRLLELADALGKVSRKSGHSSTAVPPLIEKTEAAFRAALVDDLNTPEALAAIFEFVRESNALLASQAIDVSDALKLRDALLSMDSVLGVVAAGLPHYAAASMPTAAEQEQLAQLQQLRDAKDYAAADALRAALASEGLDVQITASGPIGRRRIFADA